MPRYVLSLCALARSAEWISHVFLCSAPVPLLSGIYPRYWPSQSTIQSLLSFVLLCSRHNNMSTEMYCTSTTNQQRNHYSHCLFFLFDAHQYSKVNCSLSSLQSYAISLLWAARVQSTSDRVTRTNNVTGAWRSRHCSKTVHCLPNGAKKSTIRSSVTTGCFSCHSRWHQVRGLSVHWGESFHCCWLARARLRWHGDWEFSWSEASNLDHSIMNWLLACARFEQCMRVCDESKTIFHWNYDAPM